MEAFRSLLNFVGRGLSRCWESHMLAWLDQIISSQESYVCGSSVVCSSGKRRFSAMMNDSFFFAA